MRLENIIRATAGTMILASVSLGYWIHPGFFFVTAFVGANLLQSSFTGICPLETILKKAGIGS